MDDSRVCMTEGIFRQDAKEHHYHKSHGNCLRFSIFPQALIATILLLRFAAVESITTAEIGRNAI